MWKVTITFHVQAESADEAKRLMYDAIDEAWVHEELKTWIRFVDGWSLVGTVESDDV